MPIISLATLIRKMYPQNPPRIWLHFCLILALFSSSRISSSYTQQTNPTLPNHSHGYPLNVGDGFEERMNTNSKIVNVDEFGAKGDGRSYDNRAFEKAWNAACTSTHPTQFVVPKNKTYVLKPISFLGPCRANLMVKIYGMIKAPDNIKVYEFEKIKTPDEIKDHNATHWITIESVENLKVKGGGTINGNGQIWWQNSCKVKMSFPCEIAPNAVTFLECKNLKVSNISIGSLGAKNATAEVSEVLVNRATISGTTNGVRIKTWQVFSLYFIFS
ncbi:unnamed protein product [Linum perenne]